MRIQKLVLERFGHFDGVELDLSGEDVLLHVIYGPNEAGKSTALTAISDLLFGMPPRTTNNFRFPYGQLRIGATLVNAAGQQLSFKRRKANAKTLLTPDEDTDLPDSALGPYLGGATREFFERMYGLNHERLRSGGKAMLDAGGDIARTLFEAGAGTAGVSAVMKQLQDEADAIGAPIRKASTRPYWIAQERLEAASARMRAEALKAADWKAAEAAAAEAVKRREELQDRLRQRRREQNSLHRVRRVAPILRTIDQLEARLADLGEHALLPEGFAETWCEAVQRSREADADVKRATEDSGRLKNELETLGDPGRWPTVSERIDQLVTGLGDYRAKCRDLPHRERDLVRSQEEIERLVRQLGAEIAPGDVAKRAPSAPAVARIRSLVAEWNRLDQQLQGAREEVRQSAARLRLAEQDLESAGSPSDPAEAAASFDAALHHGDVEARLGRARRDLEEAEDNLRALASTLPYWTGTVDELATASLPDAEAVLEFEEALRKLEADEKDLASERTRLKNERSSWRGDIAALQAGGEVPTQDALRSVREWRDKGWALIRRIHVEGDEVPDDELGTFAPAGDLAGEYERAVGSADEMADRREREASRIERFAAASGSLAKAELDLEELEAQAQPLRARREAWEEGWRDRWSASGISPTKPADMRRWLLRKDEVLTRRDAARSAGKTVQAVEDEAKQVRSHLLHAAAALGLRELDDLDLAALRQRIGAALAATRKVWERGVQARRSLEAAEEGYAERHAALQRTEEALEAWRRQWEEEVPLLGLPSDASAEEAEAALEVWREIGRVLTDMDQTQRRRDQMNDAIDAYEQQVRDLQRDLGDASEDLDQEGGCSVLVPVLQRRLGEAQQLAARQADVRARIAAAESTLEKCRRTAQSAAAELRSLREVHGLDEQADVVALAQASDGRRSLQKALDDERLKLAEHGDNLSEEDLRSSVRGVDIDLAAADVVRLDEEISQLQGELEDAVRQVAETSRQLDDLRGREGAGEAAQEANDAAAEMLSHAERWLRLRAAQFVLGRAVERYREANEDPLVTRASEIFSAIASTGDDPIVRISVDYTDETKPTLVGYRRDGALCPVSGMSDGTRDQLYLALRIAAVEQHATAGEPLPFVADDLFITSDEARTVPGIKALAELGRHAQVLLFTHHRYVIEAAEEALIAGQLRVHSLAESSYERRQAAI